MNPMKNVGEVSSFNIDPELLNLRSVCHVEKNVCSNSNTILTWQYLAVRVRVYFIGR